jgi:NAD(P)-dependent dehydrogenase (short-subunit alcohol dehydrogenase family)
MSRLAGRAAIVTGGAGGIGTAIAKAFIAEGASVVVADRNADAARKAASALGPAAEPFAVDVTKEEEVQALVKHALTKFARIDILVNNAGNIRKAYVKDMTEETWDAVLDVNLKATFFCSKAVLPAMIAARKGRIVNIASIAGKVGEPTASAYSAAKWGVLGFTRSLALEVAPYDILVNAICPGPDSHRARQAGLARRRRRAGRGPRPGDGARQLALAARAPRHRRAGRAHGAVRRHPTIATSPPARRSTSMAAS